MTILGKTPLEWARAVIERVIAGSVIGFGALLLSPLLILVPLYIKNYSLIGITILVLCFIGLGIIIILFIQTYFTHKRRLEILEIEHKGLIWRYLQNWGRADDIPYCSIHKLQLIENRSYKMGGFIYEYHCPEPNCNLNFTIPDKGIKTLRSEATSILKKMYEDKK